MQVNAQRDNATHCIHYQSVMGHYCGCENNNNDNNKTNSICRLCGTGTDLPDPQMILNTTTAAATATSSCIEQEFQANLEGTCDEVTSLYGATCCAGTPSPTPPTSAAFAITPTAAMTTLPLVVAVVAFLL